MYHRMGSPGMLKLLCVQAMPPNARQLTQRLEAFLQVADVAQALTGPQASTLTALSPVCACQCASSFFSSAAC